MKDNKKIHKTSDMHGNPVTYGTDANCTFLEITLQRDRFAIYGDDKSSYERMRYEINRLGIKIPHHHDTLFGKHNELAA